MTICECDHKECFHARAGSCAIKECLCKRFTAIETKESVVKNILRQLRDLGKSALKKI